MNYRQAKYVISGRNYKKIVWFVRGIAQNKAKIELSLVNGELWQGVTYDSDHCHFPSQSPPSCPFLVCACAPLASECIPCFNCGWLLVIQSLISIADGFSSTFSSFKEVRCSSSTNPLLSMLPVPPFACHWNLPSSLYPSLNQSIYRKVECETLNGWKPASVEYMLSSKQMSMGTYNDGLLLIDIHTSSRHSWKTLKPWFFAAFDLLFCHFSSILAEIWHLYWYCSYGHDY